MGLPLTVNRATTLRTVIWIAGNLKIMRGSTHITVRRSAGARAKTLSIDSAVTVNFVKP